MPSRAQQRCSMLALLTPYALISTSPKSRVWEWVAVRRPATSARTRSQQVVGGHGLALHQHLDELFGVRDLLGRSAEDGRVVPSSSAQVVIVGFVAEPGARLEGEADVGHLLADADHGGQRRLRLDADPVDQRRRLPGRTGRRRCWRSPSDGRPGRSLITSSQRTGRPVAKSTGMPAACAASTAAAFCALTVPSGERKVPSRSVAISSRSTARRRSHYSREPGVVGDPGDRPRVG